MNCFRAGGKELEVLTAMAIGVALLPSGLMRRDSETMTGDNAHRHRLVLVLCDTQNHCNGAQWQPARDDEK